MVRCPGRGLAQSFVAMTRGRPRVEPVLLVAALLGGACAAPATRTSSPVPSGQVYTVQRGTVVHEVHAAGALVPARWASLAPRVEGYVAEVLVAPGDHVAAGQTLLTLKSGILDAAVARAEADVRAAEARLVLGQAPPRPAELAAVQATVRLEQARQAGGGPAAAEAETRLRAAEARL